MLRCLSRVSKSVSRKFSQSFLNFHEGHSPYDHLFDRMTDNYVHPNHPTENVEKIMKIMLSEEEALFLSRFPIGAVRVETISANYQDGESSIYSENEIQEMCERLCRRGMLCAVEVEGMEFFYFPEMIVGWFEFIWMRDRKQELPTEELAKLFEDYMFETFGPERIKDQDLRVMRAMCYDESVPDEIKVLDYESAVKTVENTNFWGISQCACRAVYNEVHPDKEPLAPLRTCMTFGDPAKMFAKYGISEEITKEEALEILEECRDLGFVQTSENTKNPLYMCNCDQTACLLFDLFRRYKVGNMWDELGLPKGASSVVTSQFIVNMDTDSCISCETCIDYCPVICYEENDDGVVLDSTDCIGCGVCVQFCPAEALYMTERDEERVYIPENTLEKIVLSALNEKRLHALIEKDDKLKRGIIKFMEKSGLTSISFVKNVLKKKIIEISKENDRAQLPK